MPWNESLQINVSAVICTKDRYFTTLPLTINSIIQQSYIPKELLIFDDSDNPLDLREHPIYQYLFTLLSKKGCEYRVLFGDKKGQVTSHYRSLQESKWPILFRLDDDEMAEPNVLETLITSFFENDNVGAVGGLILDPKNNYSQLPSLASGKIEDLNLGLNIQWFKHKDNSIKHVDHLYSSFIYRKDLAEYCLDLSPVGHREETLLTYSIKRKGYNLLVNPNCITWHFRFPEGGIRTNNVKAYFDNDDLIFKQKLKEYNVKLKDFKFVVLNAGLGDHLIFKKILPELKAKYDNIIIACCYSSVFEDETNIKIISIAEASLILNIEDYNLYKYLIDHSDRQINLEQAFREIYL